MAENATLETKLVGNIEGNFFIPSYQRGYRWEKEHITMLLNDIYDNGAKSYCLQPIVVKSIKDGEFELIDGQQRLTSIFLILKYMKQLLPFVEQKFSLEYETRDRSKLFLDSLDENLKDENVDFHHMFNAYTAIEEWFDDGAADKSLKAINLYKYFSENVKVIWYQVDKNQNPIALFTRLNIGKIPLTNAELVKALFLSKDVAGLTSEKQLEIATSWDAIEKELHDKSFWSFLTNDDVEEYPTRIELIFNMITNKASHEKERFYTFFYFTERMKTKLKTDEWKEIQEFYLILKEWYEKRGIYHKVGYLVASGVKIQELIKGSKKLTKNEFDASLNSKIIEHLDLTRDQLLGLSYGSLKDKSKIENLLLLLNIETVRLLKDSSEKYSFEHHKLRNWSLEHIHAQNSEGLNKQADQQAWLTLHKASLKQLSGDDDYQNRINEVIRDIDEKFEEISQVLFDDIFTKVTLLLSENEDRSYIDLVSNMALLSIENNAALNNSTFDVKRNKILEMDRNGEYIPICTRRVFLKYYSNSNNTQLQFWGEDDRRSYIEAMVGKKGLLMPYLKNNAGE